MQIAPLKTLDAADRRIRALGHTMFNLLAERGECTDQLLIAEGYSRHELEQLGHAARDYANGLFIRRDDIEAIARVPLKTDDELLTIALDRCGGLVGEAQIVAALRQSDFTIESIDRLWDRLMPRLATRIGKRVAVLPRPAPAAGAVQ